jgi:hypothetical protein
MKANEMSQRLALLLTEGALNPTEFDKFRKWLKTGGLDECLEVAEQVSRQLRHIRIPTEKNEELGSLTEQTIRSVERLLLVEAGLDEKVLIKLVAKRLGGGKVESIMIAPFSRAMTKLIEKYGGSAVLSAAQQIRNEIVHRSSNPDWPLKEQS